jgi:hypothetical protein
MSYLGSPPQFAQFPSKFFDGDGSAMTVTLDYAPPNLAALLVFISGVRQDTSAYTLSGTSLTFTGTVPSGTANVQVVHLGQLAEIPTPGDDTVSAAKLQSDSVITAKILDDNVTTAKILDNNVTLAKMAGLARGKIIYGDTSGDPAALAVGSSGTALTSDGTDIAWGSVGTAWQSVQTTGFTAVAGNGYPCNTTSGSFTATLPASASVGDTIEFVDYAGTWDTNELDLDPQSLKIKGSTDNIELLYERQGVRIVYVDATQGWVAATGVNETNPALDPIVYSTDFLIVAGGGGASFAGGGAGGYRTSTQSITKGNVITATIGAGGVSFATGTTTNGGDSSISGTGLTTITSAGGGFAGGETTNFGVGGAGGSGGGGGGAESGGSGNTPVTSPVQGYGGGTGYASAPNYGGGGGGGASAVGTNSTGGTSSGGGVGGAGLANSITGASVVYAGGGGGCYAGAGGSGGGGNAATTTPGSGDQDGTANTGGGAGGADTGARSGGSGVVILSLPTIDYSGTTTGSPTVTTSGDNTIIKFTGTGTYTA